jgi:cell division septal protein FtsQ
MAYTPTKKLADKHKKTLIRRSITLLISVLCIAGSIIFIFHLDNFRIGTVSVIGTTSISEAEVKDLAKAVIDGSYGHVLPRNSILLYPKQEITSTLHSKFLKVLSVKVQRDGLRGITISIQERTPFALWCGSDILTAKVNGKCYFMDSDGLLYTEAPTFSSDVYLQYYGGTIEGKNILGKHYLPATDFKNLDRFVRTLISSGVETKHILVSDGSIEIYLGEKETPFSTRLRFSLAQPYDKSLSAFNTFISAQTTMTTVQKYLKTVEYINFRFGNKIYSKARK